MSPVCLFSFYVRSLTGQPLEIRMVAVESDDPADPPIYTFSTAVDPDSGKDIPPSVLVAVSELDFRNLDLALDAGARLYAACGEGADMNAELAGAPVSFEDLIAADQQLP